jgi:hypothetical protein
MGECIMRLTRLALGSLVLALVFSAQARAATITVYTDASAFAAAVGSTTLIDFEAQNANGDNGYEQYPLGLTVGDVTFAQPETRLFVFGKNVYDTQGLTSDYLNQNCCAPSGIDVSFTTPVTGVGMELGYIPFATNSNDVTFTLSTGDILHTTVPQVYSSTNPLVFFGFTSDVPIAFFNINGSSEGVVIDNLQYADSLSAVPDLTSTLSLLSMGLAGLITARKRFSR